MSGQDIAIRALASLAIYAWAVPGGAQDFPARPITIVVPFPAGPGGSDALARILAERMQTTLSQAVIVENVPGAGGTIGAGRVARAAADGYTLILGSWASHVGGSAVYPVKFDVVKDFEPVALLGSNPLWIVAKKALPPKNLKELIAWLRANPDKPSAGTVGLGSASHICGIYFQNQTGTRFQFVPYRGGPPAMQDLISGQIDLMCDNASNSLSLVQNGQIKAYAVMTEKRWALARDIPTVDESGITGLRFSFWYGLWARGGTPTSIVAKLNSALVEALSEPTTRQRIENLGLEIFPRNQQTPQTLTLFLQSEIEKWGPIIKAANIKAQ